MTAVHTFDAASVLGLLPGAPRLLALGEPTHGEDVLLELRNDLFRQLAEDHHYRTIAIESDCLRALLVDDYVTTGKGDLDEVMEHGFSHGFGASAANRDLVRWMRDHNDGRPAAEQVRFAGFDGPLEIAAADSPRQALTALHSYLAARVDPGLLPCSAPDLDDLLGPDERWTEPAAMRDPSRSAGRTADADRLRLLTDDLAALLDAQSPQLIADGFDRARLHGRTAAGLLRYHHAMADTSAARMARVLAARAAIMAGNLLAVAEHGPALVHANNGHLQRDLGSMRMGGPPVQWWPAGAIVSARLGADYAVVATALGTIRHRGVGTPPDGTLEGQFYALPQDRFLVDPRRLTAPPAARVSPWFGYAPLDPARLANLDGIVFVKDAPEGEIWWPPVTDGD
ncbi:erythromycin esterase family protein [Actinoplanes sp. NPDC024001]|uniref:erythromycin esterase family protein n=1 Tax=Actinoplanes sp. NPDC024001 TaxID=3154598 RepID=UPI0034100757